MATGEECICCCEIVRVVDKVEGTGAPCIIEYDGFDAVCFWVLQTAYYHYKEQYGRCSDKPEMHE